MMDPRTGVRDALWCGGENRYVLDGDGGAADWDHRLSAALRRLALRSALYLLVASAWFLSGFALVPLGPGLLYQPSHLLVDRPPAGAGSLVIDRDLTAADTSGVETATAEVPLQGRVRAWAGADGQPAYYAAMLVFPSGFSADHALRNAAQDPVDETPAPPRVDPDQQLPGLSAAASGGGPYFVQRAGYVFLLEVDGQEPAAHDAVTRWKRQQEDRVPFSPPLAVVLPGWVHSPAAVSGWLAVVITWYAAMANLTAPLRYGITRLRQVRTVSAVPRTAAALPTPEQPAGTVDVADAVSRRRGQALAGMAVRCVGFLLVVSAWRWWWWSAGSVPLAPFTLAGAVALVRLGDRVAGSRRRRASYRRMLTAATVRDRILAGLWLLLALVTLLSALVWTAQFGDSTTVGSTAGTSGHGDAYSWPGLVLLPVATWALRRGRYRIELTAGQALEDDLRPPVLYLRSFADDRLIVRSHASNRRGLLERYTYRHWEPFEEVVAWQLWAYGPVVAAAEPGAWLRPLGAVRETLDDSVDEIWRTRIAELAEQAALIVVLVGRTESLAWELECLHRLGRLDQTIFLLPPEPQRSRAERWDAARQTLDSLGRRLPRLPRGPGNVLAAVILADRVVFATARHHSDWSYEAALETLVAHVREPHRVRGERSPQAGG